LQIAFDNYVFDTDLRELRQGQKVIAAEPQVFDLLLYLIENRDRVVSKDDLIASVWRGRIVSDSTLDSRINAARKAIGDSGQA
jgi:DNA-binding winged helix-turn-helix (wHTH) protein